MNLILSYYINFRWMLKYYISFSTLYNKLIGNKLNDILDIKLKIWNFYKINIAYDIIDRFIFKTTYQCTDCFRINWKKNPKNSLNNYYKAPACFREQVYYTDTTCCEKTICLFGCSFNIKCEQCNIILYNIDIQRSENDEGWNPIEGKNYIWITCYNCEYENKINLTMINCSDYNQCCKWLGKTVKNRNKYIIENNTRVIK